MVFALAEKLNPGINVEKIKLGTLDISKAIPGTEQLPDKWIDDLAYAIPAAGKAGTNLIFVPFFDAGQNASMFAVWVEGE